MSYAEIEQIIIAVCPTASAIITLLIGFLSLIKTIKAIRKESDDAKAATVKELEKFNRSLSKLNAKVVSIETTLSERERK